MPVLKNGESKPYTVSGYLHVYDICMYTYSLLWYSGTSVIQPNGPDK